MSIALGQVAHSAASGVKSLTVALTGVRSGSSIVVFLGLHTGSGAALTCSDDAGNVYKNTFFSASGKMQAFISQQVGVNPVIHITVGTLAAADANFMVIAQEVAGDSFVYWTGEYYAFNTAGGSSSRAGAGTPIGQPVVSVAVPNQSLAVLGVWRTSGGGPTGATNMTGIVNASAGTETLSAAGTTPPGTQFTTETPYYVSYGGSVLEYLYMPVFQNVPGISSPSGVLAHVYQGPPYDHLFPILALKNGSAIVVGVLISQLSGKATPNVSVFDGLNTYTQVAELLEAPAGNTYQLRLKVFVTINSGTTPVDVTVHNATTDLGETDVAFVAVVGSAATSEAIGATSGGTSVKANQAVSSALPKPYVLSVGVWAIDGFDIPLFPYLNGIPIGALGGVTAKLVAGDPNGFIVGLCEVDLLPAAKSSATLPILGTTWLGVGVGIAAVLGGSGGAVDSLHVRSSSSGGTVGNHRHVRSN